jgi:hypothetical protein
MVREMANMAQPTHNKLRSDLACRLFLDCLNDARDELRELFKRRENRITAEGISFGEKYIEGRISVILHMEFTATEAMVNQSIWPNPCRQDDREIPVLVFGVQRDCHEMKHGDQAAMLINDVQIVQSIQSIIPSAVGLYCINDKVADSSASSLYFSIVNRTYKFLPCFSEWKFGVPIGIEDNFARHQVESGMKIMDGVSQNQTRVRWEGFNQVDLEKIVFSLGIFLHVQTARVGFNKPLPEGVKIGDVFIGSFDL